MTKFKVWSKEDNDWVKNICFLSESGELFSDGFKLLDPENHEVCFYIGRTDNNGQELYCGDIVKNGNNIKIVKWVDDSYCFDVGLSAFVYDQEVGCDLSNTTKIGTKFENPELLEA